MSAWLGGIAVLVFALRTATASLAPEQRTPLLATVVGALLGRSPAPRSPSCCSPAWSRAIVEVGRFGALLDTAFGRARADQGARRGRDRRPRRVQPPELVPALKRPRPAHPARPASCCAAPARRARARPDRARRHRRAARATRPRPRSSSGPYSTTVNVGPARVEVTVDPARVGPNELHLYLFDRKTGAPSRARRSSASPPRCRRSTSPSSRSNSHVAGPGHYVVDGASLGVRATGRSRSTVRVSDFDEYAQRFTVPIDG